MFVEGASRFDVSQGMLGDCWFVAVLSSLAQFPSLLAQVSCVSECLLWNKYTGSGTSGYDVIGTCVLCHEVICSDGYRALKVLQVRTLHVSEAEYVHWVLLALKFQTFCAKI